jgi:predicted tellurium resistance membrane protein TerC
MKKVSKKKSTKKSVKSVSNKIVEKKRGFFLTFWLALILTGNIVAAFFYLFWADLIVQIAETIPVWSIYTLGILGLVNIVLILNLFMWKKWAFYGIIGKWSNCFCD